MIEKTQKRFIQISMASFTVVMLVLFISINGLNIWQNINHLDTQLDLLINQVDLPEEIIRETRPAGEEETMQNPPLAWNIFDRENNPEARFMIRYFSTEVDQEGQITTLDLEQIYAIDEETATDYALNVIDSQKMSGWISRYYYRVSDTDEGNQRIYFVDGTRELSNIIEVVIITSVVFILCVLVVYGLLIYFSKIAISPLIKNIERQKEFIHNASHELKTPLTILSTNNDIIEMEFTSNDWTQSNRQQIKRLNNLIEQMLLLARFDEGQEAIELEEKNIKVVIEEVLSNMKQLILTEDVDIQVDVSTTFKQAIELHMFSLLLEILLDNAIKYHVRGYPIKIYTENKQLIVSNKVQHLDEEQVSQLFDRFYRPEVANEQAHKGSGIGLSIAKGVAKANKLHLSANLEEDTIQFKLGW